MALLTNLKAWWDFEEASGTRTDAHGANDLTDNNTVTSTTGLQGTSAQFVRANSENLSITDNADLSVGDYDWMFAGWVKFDSLTGGGNWTIISKGTGVTAGTLEYRLNYAPGSSRFTLRVGWGGATLITATANNFGAASTATWYFVEVWFQASANQIGIRVNRGTADTASFTNAPFDSTGTFRFGLDANAGDAFTGQLDSWGRWNELLSSTDLDTLYNSGAGVDYADISGGGAATVEGAAAISGTGSLTGASLVNVQAAAAISGTGALASAALVNVQAQSALSGTGALSGAGLVEVQGSTALSGTGTLTGASLVNVQASAALDGTGALVAAGQVEVFASASLSASGAMDATAVMTVLAEAALSGAGALSAAGDASSIPTVYGAAVLSGTGSLDGAALVDVRAAASLDGASTLAADSFLTIQADAALSGLGNLQTNPYLTTSGAAALSGLGSLVAAGIIGEVEIPVTPDNRSYTVPTEARAYIVPAELRLFTVAAESRTARA
jgi:hypothetical protein